MTKKKKRKKIRQKKKKKQVARHGRAKKTDEKKIIEKVKGGDARCFAEIVNKYKGVVFNHARSFLRNREEAEDAAQEIFVNIYRNIGKFRGDSQLSTWIYRITVNVCKNRLKQMARHKSRIIEPLGGDSGEGDESEKMLKNLREKQEKQPDASYFRESMKGLVLKKIHELSPEQRDVIILRDVDGMSYGEISKILKLSVSAVKSKLFRARDNLREKLEKDDII